MGWIVSHDGGVYTPPASGAEWMDGLEQECCGVYYRPPGLVNNGDDSCPITGTLAQSFPILTL